MPRGKALAAGKASMDSVKLPLVIATKLLAPRGGGSLVERQRLLALLGGPRTPRLVVITAPAGFGKTTLAAAWLQRLREAGHRCAWLALDPVDDEPARFLSYLAQALSRVMEGAGPSIDGTSTEASLAPPQAIVSALINDLAEIDEETYLVLDDYHVMSDPAIHDAVSFLVMHAPENFHLVLTARAQPPLPLARLRAQGELLEIDATALRFDANEARQFLERACEGRLGPGAISRLHATTEGWVAALRIAASGILRSGEAAGTALSGGSRPIAAYIEDMLASLPDEAVAFMTRAAVLDSLTPGLCRAVTGVQASAQMLENLVSRQVLLEPLDAERQWYRFHHLLLDYLRVRLAERHTGELPQLHRRAFAWYAEQELWTDAARHAIAAGDADQAIAWIARCGMTLVKRGDLLTLLGWQRQFPAELMRGQIKVRLAIAWGMTLAMRFDSALAMLDEAEQDARADKPPEDLADVLWECQAVRAVIAALRDDTAAALALAEACIVRRSDDPWNTNVLSNVLRFARWKAGDLDGVHATPWIPYSLEEDRRNLFSSVYRHCILGMAELDQARFDLAERQAQAAMRLAEQHVGAQSGAAALCAPILAELRYEEGRLDEAENWVIDRIALIDSVVFLEGVLRAYIVLARIAAARSNVEYAYSLLAQAEALGYNRQWDRLVTAVLLERTRLLLAEGRMSEASACVVRIERLAAVNPAPVECARSQVHRDQQLARARLASAQNRWTEAVDILDALLGDARSSKNNRAAMQVGSSLALARLASGDTDGALLTLRGVLDLASNSRAYRSILDAGPDLAHLLVRFRASSRCTKALEACVDRLLAGCQRAGGSVELREHAARVSETLSQRERSILGLIAKGQSNKEVARALGVAPETVKSHLKNIFGKLSVERRAQAVARARSLGLIEGA